MSPERPKPGVYPGAYQHRDLCLMWEFHDDVVEMLGWLEMAGYSHGFPLLRRYAVWVAEAAVEHLEDEGAREAMRCLRYTASEVYDMQDDFERTRQMREKARTSLWESGHALESMASILVYGALDPSPLRASMNAVIHAVPLLVLCGNDEKKLRTHYADGLREHLGNPFESRIGRPYQWKKKPF